MTGKKSFFFFNKVSTKENKRRAKSKGGWGIQKMTKKEKKLPSSIYRMSEVGGEHFWHIFPCHSIYWLLAIGHRIYILVQ